MILLAWSTQALAADPCGYSGAILEAYEQGEAERADRSATALSVLKRDERRAELMVSFDKKGRLCTADDKWHAAWLMMQSDELSVIERAHEIAVEAMNEGHPNGPWLVAFTFDRERVLGGYRQSYGSQTRINDRGQECLIEVESDITDEDRKSYGHPPLSEVYRTLLDHNGFSDDAPTFERLSLRGLYCPPLALSKRAQKKIREAE